MQKASLVQEVAKLERGWKLEDYLEKYCTSCLDLRCFIHIWASLEKEADLCLVSIQLLCSYSGVNGQTGMASVVGWCMSFKEPF